MTKKQRKAIIAKTREELLSATGIDFDKYRNVTMTEKVTDMLIFPLYVLPALVGSIILSLFAFAVSNLIYLAGSPSLFREVVYLLVGLPLFFVLGVTIGGLVMVRKISKDMRAIMGLASDTIACALEDVCTSSVNLNAKATEALGHVPRLSQIARGIFVVALLPIFEQVISRKVKLVGTVIAGITGNILLHVTNGISTWMGDTVAECSAVKNGEQKIAAALHKASSCVSSAAENEGLKQLRQSAPVFIEKVTQKADSMIIAATQKIAFPLKVSCAGLGFVAVMLLGSMLLRNQ